MTLIDAIYDLYTAGRKADDGALDEALDKALDAARAHTSAAILGENEGSLRDVVPVADYASEEDFLAKVSRRETEAVLRAVWRFVS